ncbi:MAG: hypothetical protein KAS30_01800 [Candidatus Diapherotrites archaeon]|nr:hypothetical protein [Candidatus Diapherotrites archaeon]
MFTDMEIMVAKYTGQAISLGGVFGFVKFIYVKLDDKFKGQEEALEAQKIEHDKDLEKIKKDMVRQDYHDLQIKTLTSSIEKMDSNNREDHKEIFKEMKDLPGKLIKLLK